jgi:hypothetical protein
LREPRYSSLLMAGGSVRESLACEAILCKSRGSKGRVHHREDGSERASKSGSPGACRDRRCCSQPAKTSRFRGQLLITLSNSRGNPPTGRWAGGRANGGEQRGGNQEGGPWVTPAVGTRRHVRRAGRRSPPADLPDPLARWERRVPAHLPTPPRGGLPGASAGARSNWRALASSLCPGQAALSREHGTPFILIRSRI